MCDHKRKASMGGKVSDCFNFSTNDIDYDGYVPSNLGIGGGDYIEINYCLDCGQILSDDFPIKAETINALKLEDGEG